MELLQNFKLYRKYFGRSKFRTVILSDTLLERKKNNRLKFFATNIRKRLREQRGKIVNTRNTSDFQSYKTLKDIACLEDWFNKVVNNDWSKLTGQVLTLRPRDLAFSQNWAWPSHRTLSSQDLGNLAK